MSGINQPARGEDRGALAWILGAVALFAGVYACRSAVGDVRDGIAFLYVLPVAILALRYGTRGGLAGAAIAIVLVLADTSADLELTALGLATRVTVLAAVGPLVGWFVDREKRLQHLHRLDEVKVRRFFELSRDMLCTANKDGYFVDLNPAWERVLGYSEEELRARPFVDLVHPADRVRTAQETGALFEGNVTVDFENRYIAKDGSVRWLRWSSVLGDDEMIYARATDATDQKAAAAALQDASRELQRSNEELRQFAYIASHDLNEPLRTIGGFAQLLDRRYASEIDDQGRDYIHRIVGGAARMQKLIADLLKFSRAGREEAALEPVDTAQLLAEVRQDLGEAIADADADIQAGQNLPTIEGDPGQIRQVFQNLVSNALKFTNGGRPVIRVSSEQLSTGWRFSIADNGIGIDPDQRERVFAAFERLHGRDEYSGTGIGLAICRKIVERHGGEIHVEDGLDGGANFVFTLAERQRHGTY